MYNAYMDKKYIIGGFALTFLIFIVGGWYIHVRFENLSQKLDNNVLTLSENLNSLSGNLSSTTEEIRRDFGKSTTELAQALHQEKQSSAAIEKKLGNFQQEVGTISSSVNTLEKLSKTDPELLQKYSKVFFLNEHYSPPRLTEIPKEYEYNEARTSKIHTEVWPYLKNLLEDAKKDEIKLYIASAFRSFNEQGALKGQYSVTYGAGTANQFSADQGYSEHQLGTTVDFITSGLGGRLEGFDNTKAYTWLLANAYKYGFVLSYPKNNKYYVFEPWHWRFVGVKLATYLKNQGQNFYDLDQRKIDEFLVSVF